MNVPYKVERISNSLVNVRMEMDLVADWEQWFFLKSDDHWDNPKCRRDILKRDMDKAQERNAGIIGAGDLFCAMQGKYDKRSSKDDVRPEHQNGRYLDSLIETAADWYAPYVPNMVAEGMGNHETAILKNHETHLTERLCERIRTQHGTGPESMGYGYWVRFHMVRANSQSQSIWLRVFHGSGGGGPVTKGVIQTNRRAVYLPDAHIVASGHIHEQWMLALRRERINSAGTITHETQWHVCTGTYKEEYGDGSGGWHVERGAPPKPIGGVWLRIFFARRAFQYELYPAMENSTTIKPHGH